MKVYNQLPLLQLSKNKYYSVKFSDQFISKHKNTVLWLESNRFTDAYEVQQLWIEDKNMECASVGIPSVVPKAVTPYLSETLLDAPS